MNIYENEDSDISSSDEEVDGKQIQLEFEKHASAEFLFTKASTNNSITSLGTKEKTTAHDTHDDSGFDQDDSVTVDEMSMSDKPSP